MKRFSLLFLACGVVSLVFAACHPRPGPYNRQAPGGGYLGNYDNIHPHQHGRYKEGRRTHAEKKYMRPR